MFVLEGREVMEGIDGCVSVYIGGRLLKRIYDSVCLCCEEGRSESCAWWSTV